MEASIGGWIIVSKESVKLWLSESGRNDFDKSSEMRDQARILMQDNIDPLEQKKKLTKIRSEDHQRTFALLTEEWIKRQLHDGLKNII